MRAGITHEEKLAELESHLREQVTVSIRSGVDEEAAFRTAVSQLGDPTSMRREFNKLSRATFKKLILPIYIVGLLAVFSFRFVQPAIVSGPLLMAHIFCLTVGYLIALMFGALGIYHVLLRLLGRPYPAGESAWRRGIFVGQWFAAVLVGTGLLLGMIWQIRGGRSSAMGLRELGTCSVLVWLAGTILIQKRGAMSLHQILMLQIIGNMLVIAAWFGAGIATNNASSYGLQSYWWFEPLIAGHLTVFLCGLLPTRSVHAEES